MPLERLEFLAVLQADDEVVGHRLLDRDRGALFLDCWRGLPWSSSFVQGAVGLLDKIREFVGGNDIAAQIGRYDAAGELKSPSVCARFRQ